jgi:two-component system sensor histidine kinase QseC
MTSIRRRTLTLIIGLMLTGLAVISVLNLHDSNHEIAEVYDAQLAQNARMLQGVMRMLASKQHAELYQAFNQALSEAEPKVDGHPYETKIAFQVWNRKGEVLVHTVSALIHRAARHAGLQRCGGPEQPPLARLPARRQTE